MSKLRYISIRDFELKSRTTQDILLSYQIFGQPIHTAPIVLVIHALTGNSNITGINGWWNDLIGDSKCIDTNKYTILAFNIPGNGYDNIADHLIENYSEFSARDIAKLFAYGIEQLEIDSIYAIIGGSVGGGIAWELAAFKPDLAQYVIPIAADWKSTDWVIANCHIQDAILNHSNKPLADARLHAMTLYRTPESFTHKFQRSKKNARHFNVESWLDHHGEKLEDRFHLSSYKLMNQLLKSIDIVDERDDFESVVQTISSHIHIVTITSDLLFKPEENWDTYRQLKSIKTNVSISEINSIHGHDAFLIEFEQLSSSLSPFFNSDTSITNENDTYNYIWNR
ncbi:alpha/beta fold hydrolase [Psychroserpens sp.]|uniref:alpha/beta fold hydrolase n=1 Tax=Psychroserpens sp. TaxID=2020870 RepID=UPI002AA8D738|nr:alpha/beta fold hydrolase [Psychroserpens sp.]